MALNTNWNTNWNYIRYMELFDICNWYHLMNTDWNYRRRPQRNNFSCIGHVSICFLWRGYTAMILFYRTTTKRNTDCKTTKKSVSSSWTLLSHFPDNLQLRYPAIQVARAFLGVRILNKSSPSCLALSLFRWTSEQPKCSIMSYLLFGNWSFTDLQQEKEKEISLPTSRQCSVEVSPTDSGSNLLVEAEPRSRNCP